MITTRLLFFSFVTGLAIAQLPTSTKAARSSVSRRVNHSRAEASLLHGAGVIGKALGSSSFEATKGVLRGSRDLVRIHPAKALVDLGKGSLQSTMSLIGGASKAGIDLVTSHPILAATDLGGGATSAALSAASGIERAGFDLVSVHPKNAIVDLGTASAKAAEKLSVGTVKGSSEIIQSTSIRFKRLIHH